MWRQAMIALGFSVRPLHPFGTLRLRQRSTWGPRTSPGLLVGPAPQTLSSYLVLLTDKQLYISSAIYPAGRPVPATAPDGLLPPRRRHKSKSPVVPVAVQVVLLPDHIPCGEGALSSTSSDSAESDGQLASERAKVSFQNLASERAKVSFQNVDSCGSRQNVDSCGSRQNVDSCGSSQNVDSCGSRQNVDSCSSSKNVDRSLVVPAKMWTLVVPTRSQTYLRKRGTPKKVQPSQQAPSRGRWSMRSELSM